MTKRVILFLAEGFEEVEALTAVDYLRRQGITVDTVSISDDLVVKGAHDIRVEANYLLGQITDLSVYDGVIIPGGMPGASNLQGNERVVEIVRDLAGEGKMAAAICAGPIVLAQAAIIAGRKLTSYPGFEADLATGVYQEEGVVVDGNMITARGPIFAADFAIALVEYLLGAEAANNLKEDILYNLR